MSVIQEKIQKKEQAILQEWQEASAHLVDIGFSPSSARQGRFSDPVSFHVNQALSDALAWLASDDETLTPTEALQDFCRLKAVQNSTPSAVFGFFFELKPIIRTQLRREDIDDAAFLQVDKRIDTLVLELFDCYEECRERLAQLRVEEVQRKEKVLQRQIDVIQRKCEKELV